MLSLLFTRNLLSREKYLIFLIKYILIFINYFLRNAAGLFLLLNYSSIIWDIREQNCWLKVL